MKRDKYNAYTITNLVTGRVYVGATCQLISKRWVQHKSAAATGRKTPLHAAMRKYGYQNFIIEHIASAFDYASLVQLEIALIEQFQCRTKQGGYNVLSGGVLTSEDAARKGALSLVGKPRPEYVRARLSQLAIGRKHSAEAKQKMSTAGRGKPKSDEWKASARKAWERRRGDRLKGASPDGRGKWSAWAWEAGKSIYLGRFDTQIEAHLASMNYESGRKAPKCAA